MERGCQRTIAKKDLSKSLVCLGNCFLDDPVKTYGPRVVCLQCLPCPNSTFLLGNTNVFWCSAMDLNPGLSPGRCVDRPTIFAKRRHLTRSDGGRQLRLDCGLAFDTGACPGFTLTPVARSRSLDAVHDLGPRGNVRGRVRRMISRPSLTSA